MAGINPENSCLSDRGYYNPLIPRRISNNCYRESFSQTRKSRDPFEPHTFLPRRDLMDRRLDIRHELNEINIDSTYIPIYRELGE